MLEQCYERNVGSVNLGRTRGDNMEQTESKDIQKENVMNVIDGLDKKGLSFDLLNGMKYGILH